MLAALPVRADEVSDCGGIVDDAARLACYDKAADSRGAAPAQVDDTGSATVTASPAMVSPDANIKEERATSYLERVWELSDRTKTGTFRFHPYQPNYFMPWRYSSHPNRQPVSPSQGSAAATPLQGSEVRFQLSFKTKLWENIFNSQGALWFGYTQQSNWQLYNTALSSPIRETDYAPELILTVPFDLKLPGMRLKMLNAGFIHQSNGQSAPYSRSWNRVYLQAGLERGNFLLMIRPWYRLPAAARKDDNPDIRQYMGSGDIQAVWIGDGQALSALGRYSFQGKKGALKLNWVFPIRGRLKGYLEYFNGYGESLIDYNHHQQIFALGILISDWP